MTKKQESQNQQYYKGQLLQRRSQILLENEVGASAAATVELDQTSVGRVSRVDALQAQAMSAAAQARRMADLHNIDEALRRVAEDEYGYCRNCGENIAPQRLEIDLAALFCIKCAALMEKQQGQAG